MAAETVFQDARFSDGGANKVNVFTGEHLTADTYYFNPGQVLAYHRHPAGDQAFVVLQGEGTFFLDNGNESSIDVAPGSLVYVPTGVWHKLANGNAGGLVACQVTSAGAGMENREGQVSH